MKKIIRINFTDFHVGFNKTSNYIYLILASKYTVIIDEKVPDYLFYSCFGFEFLKYDCIRIYYTGENVVPDFNLCDYATGYAYIAFGDRYLRFPDYTCGHLFGPFVESRRLAPQTRKPKSRFCNFIYSNPAANPIRDTFYHLLSKYKRINSAGTHLNNTSLESTEAGWSMDKLAFITEYKFTIAFENSSSPGYTTEKILHAFLGETIPIYWGDPLVGDVFNTDAFINCHDYASLDDVINKIKQVDEDDVIYNNMLRAPVFKGDSPDYLNHNYLLDFYSAILDQPLEKVSRRPHFGYQKVYEQRFRQLLEDIALSKKPNAGLKGIIKRMVGKIGIL